MKNPSLVQITPEFFKEMRLLSVKHAKAVQLMHLLMEHMDEDNDAKLTFLELYRALDLDMHRVLYAARAIQQLGWLDALIYDTDVLSARINRDHARWALDGDAEV